MSAVFSGYRLTRIIRFNTSYTLNGLTRFNTGYTMITGDPKTRNGGMTEPRNGGKSPEILKRGTADNHP